MPPTNLSGHLWSSKLNFHWEIQKGSKFNSSLVYYIQLYGTKYFESTFNFWTNFQFLAQCGCASPPTNLSGHLWSSKRNFVKSPTRARNLHSLHFHAIFHGCDMKYATKISVCRNTLKRVILYPFWYIDICIVLLAYKDLSTEMIRRALSTISFLEFPLIEILWIIIIHEW